MDRANTASPSHSVAIGLCTELEKPRFLEKKLRFLGFHIQKRPDTKLRPSKNMLYIIFPVTPFSIIQIVAWQDNFLEENVLQLEHCFKCTC